MERVVARESRRSHNLFQAVVASPVRRRTTSTLNLFRCSGFINPKSPLLRNVLCPGCRALALWVLFSFDRLNAIERGAFAVYNSASDLLSKPGSCTRYHPRGLIVLRFQKALLGLNLSWGVSAICLRIWVRHHNEVSVRRLPESVGIGDSLSLFIIPSSPLKPRESGSFASLFSW